MTGPGTRWGSINLPDDWGTYFTTCSRCGHRYHLSEGGCDACADLSDEEVERAEANRDHDAEMMAELRADAREDRRRDEEGRNG